MEIKGIPEDTRPVCSLVGIDGNAYSIIATVTKALKKAGLTEEAKQYQKEATSGDYNHLIAVSMSYVREPVEDLEDDNDDDAMLWTDEICECGMQLDDDFNCPDCDDE